MRNPDLPKLLRVIGGSEYVQACGGRIIYEQTAIELEKLEKIYTLIDNAVDDMHFMTDVVEILKNG